MSKELQIMSVSDIMIMAQTFAESGMFTDAKQIGQAFVKIQAGQEIGIPPFAAMSGIHIIQGKPAIGAGLMASTVKGSGKYDYKVIEHTAQICSIDFYQGKERLGNSSFDLEKARKAGTKNLDKFPENMLFARAMSNGVKWFCPDVFSGPVYTPEELNTIDIPHIEITKSDLPNIEVHEAQVLKIPTLNAKQFEKLMAADIETIERNLRAIEELKLKVTEEQHAAIHAKYQELQVAQ